MKLIARPRSWRPNGGAVVALAASLLTASVLAACATGVDVPSRGRTASGHATASTSKRPVTHPPSIGRTGIYRVGRYTARMTYRPAGRDGDRALRVIVSYPIIAHHVIAALADTRAGGGLFPLVIFAPGYRQCLTSYGPLLRFWSSAGYVVAAVQFPRTNCHVLVPDEADLASQPRDVSHVISRMISASRQRAGRLSGLIDSAKIAVAGHSDGGDTAAATVANTCCLDHRVSAAVALAGAEWPPLPGRYFAGPTVPMLFVQGTADTWNPPDASVQLYRADTRGRRYYLELLGADHFSPYEGNGPTERLVAKVTLDFLNRFVAGQPKALRAMRLAAKAPGRAELASAGRFPGR